MPRTKDTYVQLRMTHLEKEKLIQQSAEARMTMTQYILALSEQKKIVVADELPELCRQIIRIGTNVNQIALVANTNLIEIQNLLGKLIDTIKNGEDEVKV